MNPGPWRREVDVALEAAREAAILARDIQQRVGNRVWLKEDQSPVTVADFAVQALVADRLRQSLPDDPLVAEEGAASLRSPAGRSTLVSVLDALHSIAPHLDANRVLEAIDRGRGLPAERFWTLDPIDGTRGFIRGDQYAVALALIVRGRVEFGVLACPQLASDGEPDVVGSIMFAIRNKGAFRGTLLGTAFTPIHVSSCGEASRAHVLRSFEREHIDLGAFNEIVTLLRVQTPPTLMDSQAKYALIARGTADLLIRVPATRQYREKLWDHAAGTILVEEAGGRVTDLHGVPLDFAAGHVLARNEGMIASNGHLHTAALNAVASRGDHAVGA